MSDLLSQLYPDQSGPPDELELLTAISSKFSDSIAAKQATLDACGPALLQMARLIARTYENGGRLLTMGNGGSACDAAHVAVEFNHPVTVGRPALPAIHLGADLPMVTAVGNDVGFDQIFARQVISHGRRGDALIGISTSGNSTNLLAAFAVARRQGLTTLGLAGHDGGKMARSELDCCVVVPANSVHRIQEAHLTCYHILWDLTHTLLADSRGNTP
ncbi:MAG: SIS domain-containing protein [Myxococcota bacterium]